MEYIYKGKNYSNAKFLNDDIEFVIKDLICELFIYNEKISITSGNIMENIDEYGEISSKDFVNFKKNKSIKKFIEKKLDMLIETFVKE